MLDDSLVVVVDDDETVRQAIADTLRGEGYQVLSASNGAAALDVLRGRRPVAIFIDLMPMMGGWELVERLRADPSHSEVPIVVLSAADKPSPPAATRVIPKPLNREDLVRAVHDVESVTRPDPEAQKARQLQQRNTELVELLRFRDEMSTLVVHDLRNPLSVVIGSLDYVLDGPLTEGAPDKTEALIDAAHAAKRMLRLIANLLDLTRMETGSFVPNRTPTRVDRLISSIVDGRRHLSTLSRVQVTSDVRFEREASIDAEVITRAMENILDNAFRYTPSGGRILISATDADGLVIRIANTGPAIPFDARVGIFDARAPTVSRARLELGLYYCRLAVEEHGGRIWLDSTTEFPTVFVLELGPSSAPPSALGK